MYDVSNEERKRILNECRQIAGKRKVLAVFLYGSQIYGYTRQIDVLDVLLVVRNFQPRVMVYSKPINDTSAAILTVDQGVFERDAEQGLLGEFAAEKMMAPYQPLYGEEYLWTHEVKLKKRTVKELLENLVNEYPELSHELLIKPEYFMYEAIERRTRLLPALTFNVIDMMHEDLKMENMEKIMRGYKEAIKELTKENIVTAYDGYIKLTEKFIEDAKSLTHRIVDFFRSIRSGFFLYILSAFQATVSSLRKEQELLLQAYGKTEPELLLSKMENPEKYLSISTPLGPVTLSDTTTIEDFVRKTVPHGENLELETRELGGILNSVYLLTIKTQGSSQERLVVVKKFKNWIGFKWFPLALWTIGTKSFAVLGKTRLEREYTINKLLQKNGFEVPRILYVSPKEHMLFEEYVKGESLDKTVKKIMKSPSKATAELELIRKIGGKIAAAHKLGIALGDCKPENIVVTANKEICFLDLEQASKDGNKTWDVAEFLYYTGHYAPPIESDKAVTPIATCFIEGYFEGGGQKGTVRKAASPRYTKVFSIFTAPHVLLAISGICRRMGAEETE